MPARGRTTLLRQRLSTEQHINALKNFLLGAAVQKQKLEMAETTDKLCFDYLVVAIRQYTRQIRILRGWIVD